MISPRTIRSVISSWLRWRSTRRLYAAHPELRHFDDAERAAKRKHASVEPIRAARREFMTAALRREVR